MNIAPAVFFAPDCTWQTEDADIVWVEITAYVMYSSGVQLLRGRSSETEQMRTATVNLQLKNEDRRFDPTYASGPYFGKLLPGVPLKVEGSANGSDVQVFRGFIDGWPQEYSETGMWSEVGITATDGLGKLALAKLPSSVYAYEVAQDSPDIWYRLNETGGTEMGDNAGSRDGTYSSPVASATDHPNTYETVSAVEFSADQYGLHAPTITPSLPLTIEGCFVAPESSNYAPIFYIGDGVTAYAFAWWADNGSLFVGLISGAPSATASYLSVGTVEPGSHVHVVGSITDTSTGVLYVNGVLVDSTVTTAADVLYPVSGANVAIGVGTTAADWSGQAIADCAYYETDLDAARCETHGLAFIAPWDGDTTGERADRILDVANWPSDLRDLATGFTNLGPAVLGATALDQLRKLEASEQGRLFISRDGKLTFHDRYYSQLVTAGMTSQVTFSDSGDVPYSSLAFDYDDRFVYGRVQASTSSGYQYSTEDATSLATYGDRTDTNLSGLDVDPGTLRALAEHRLLTYKDPALRPRPITVPLHSNAIDDATAETLLSLDLGMRVTIERTPQGVGSAISQEAVIESISHRLNGHEWHVTYALSPAPITSYGLWGDDWGTATWGP